ncbi:MAG: phytoene desaturase [Balneolaceae bacterium]|nr:phytoene desaturase [Balneolaceae bacterium]MCH8549080.1 phytoene desaturase [Balneolaceae bacterium]
MKNRAVVIGAGLGGVASAALLAFRGYDVTVFESNATVGGKMQELERDGYRFDTGPSLFTMPFLLEKLFSNCGESLSDYLQFDELKPLCRYFWKDGIRFDNYAEREKSMEEIRRFSPSDADAYSKFLDRAEEIYNKTADAFLFNPLYQLSDLKNLRFQDFLGIDAFSTVSDVVDDRFSSPHMRQFFKRFTTYNGSSPYLAPATLNVIPHVELNQGGYYVRGGMYRIAESLSKLAEKKGVQFRFNTRVESILVEGHKAVGVKTSKGEEFRSDALFANSDATETILKLLPSASVSTRKRESQEQIEPSCSGFVMMIGAEKRWDNLCHHNIFFSDDYEREFDDIFKRKVMPEDPTIYLANTSYTDPDHAPEGSSNLYILVNAPYMADHQDWDEIARSYSAFLIRELESRGLDGLSEAAEFVEVITPEHFYQKYGSNRGSIYGTSSNNRFAAFLRPRNALREVDNLYLTGGSTHPGGGIPLVIQSAFNAVELMDRS